MRVVFDSNVFISAFVIPGSQGERAFLLARRKRFDTRKLGEKSPYEQSFIQCMNLWEDSPAVSPLTFHPIICETAARLFRIPVKAEATG